ncbi:MAG: hypothetical protein IIA87_00815 [Nanoarchaeota archaeon]|nr:hypothetical protein [Nanoarchaeota archaeon]
MVKVRQQQYDLSCRVGEYEALLDSLKSIASGQFPTDERDWTTYVIISENVELSLMDQRKENENGLAGRVLMSVKRTSLREPKFIRQIVKRLEGKLTSSSVGSNEETVNLYLDDSYEELEERKRRSRAQLPNKSLSNSTLYSSPNI